MTPASEQRTPEPPRSLRGRRREADVVVEGRRNEGRRGARSGALASRRRGSAGASRAARHDQVAVEAALLHVFGLLVGW